MASLWGDEFTKKKPDPKEKTKKILDKIAKPKKVKTVSESVARRSSRKMTPAQIVAIVQPEVYRRLGKFVDNTIVIKDKKELEDYVSKAIKNSIVAVDTETNNSLQPTNCLIAGLCLYTPGMKQAYIPINHVDLVTEKRIPDQLTEQDVKEQLIRIVELGVKAVYHNSSFDMQVIKETIGVFIPPYWDTLIGARLLNENESAKLKDQYILHCDSNQAKYSINDLFEALPIVRWPPELFALYAAADPFETYELYLYQKPLFEQEGMEHVYKLFKEVEMPLTVVTAGIETRGIELDDYYSPKLSKKYHKIEEDINRKVLEELEKLKPQIEAWKLSPEAQRIEKGSPIKDKLSDPVKVSSPTQLAILLYDVLKVPVKDKKKPRGTGEEILEQLDLPICKLILESRGITKLISTYIDKLPQVINPKTGRIHCKFNQLGTGTGRFSSSDPNLQNIPSSNKEIRMMFRARTDKDEPYLLVGSDFSGQEVRLAAFYSKDPRMIEAYKEGKDLYAVIAQFMFDNKYEDNLEHNPDGSIYEDGKHRRAEAKTVLLGLLYGRGAASIAAQINKTPEEGQKIIDTFFKNFPDVKRWIDRTLADAHKYGYVEDWYGRRRHLPEMLLPKYSINDLSLKDKNAAFNPFLECSNRVADKTKVDKYKNLLKKIKGRKHYEQIKMDALKEGIEIIDNSGKIAAAERESVNSRVQGGAATLTKLAMLNVDRDNILNSLGFKMLITVHDEIIGECPAKNAEEAAKRLTEVMIKTANAYMEVPMSCDPTIESCWYLSEFKAIVLKEFNKLIKSGMSDIEAFEKICGDRVESTRGNIYEIVGSLLSKVPDNINDE